MRISKLIEKLEAYKREHGDHHVKTYDRRGDEGTPVVDTMRWIRGCKRDKVYCIVKAEDWETPDV